MWFDGVFVEYVEEDQCVQDGQVGYFGVVWVEVLVVFQCDGLVVG